MKSHGANVAINLLTIALVLLAAVVFGTRVTSWWREDGAPPVAVEAVSPGPPPPGAAASAFFHLPSRQSTVELKRRPFVGDYRAAQRGLRELLASVAEACPVLPSPPGPKEIALLELLTGDDAKPAAQSTQDAFATRDASEWRMYEQFGPALLAVVVKEVSAGAHRERGQARISGGIPADPGRIEPKNEPVPDKAGEGSSATGAVIHRRRVVCWGIGVFAGADPRAANCRWTLIALQPAAETSSPANRGAVSPIPLPPGVEATLALGDATEGQLVFRGETGSAGRRFFEAWADENGYHRRGKWQAQGSIQTARFENEHITIQISLFAQPSQTGGLITWRSINPES